MKQDTDRPNPEFAQHLEWQLESELRRELRFGGRRAPRRSLRWAQQLALVLLALVVGAAGGVAAERKQDEERAALEVARAQVRMELAQGRLELLKQRSEREQALIDSGLMPESADRQRAVREAEYELELCVSRLEETRLSGREASDELIAPVVGRRDFVSERLRIEADRARLGVEMLEEVLEWTRRLYEQGFVSEGEAAADEQELVQVRARVAQLEGRLSLRLRFLAGELDAVQVEREARADELRLAIQGVRERIELAQNAREMTRRMVEEGLVSQAELASDELDLTELQAELELYELELALLER